MSKLASVLHRNRRSMVWMALSVCLGFASFPGFDMGWLAWVSVVPMLYGYLKFDSKKSGNAFLVAFIWIKWILLVVWMRHISWFAVFGIAGGFASIEWFWFVCLRRKIGTTTQPRMDYHLSFLDCFVYGCLWAALEWARTQPIGLPGAHLSITLWRIPELIQIASIIGGYGLSGVIVIVNLLITKLILGSRSKVSFDLKDWIPGVLAFVIVALLWLGGHWRLRMFEESIVQLHEHDEIGIGVVQPYQPAVLAWTYEIMTDVIMTTLQESVKVASENEIDLIVWPEGSLPGAIYSGSSMAVEVEALTRRIATPLLFGNQVKKEGNYYNGILNCDPKHGISDDFYGKRILVPFGEYIPGRRFLGDIATIVPIPEDFSSGNSSQIMTLKLDNRKVNISSLICYEDCFPELLLSDDMQQVDLVYVATYNVWYGEEFGAYFHAAHSVMRAVENARSILRCGSAGWSGLISPVGVIEKVVRDSDTGSIYFRGSDVIRWKKPVRMNITFYDRYHLLIHLTFGWFGIVALVLSFKHRQ